MNKRFFYYLPVSLSVFFLFSLLSVTASNYSAAGIKDSVAFDSFYEQLRHDITINDREAASKLFQYPMNIKIPVFQKTLHIDSASAFLENYDQIFPLSVKNALQKAPASALWSNREGVAMHDGDVWFNINSQQKFTIITVNPKAASQLVSIPSHPPKKQKLELPKPVLNTHKTYQ